MRKTDTKCTPAQIAIYLKNIVMENSLDLQCQKHISEKIRRKTKELKQYKKRPRMPNMVKLFNQCQRMKKRTRLKSKVKQNALKNPTTRRQKRKSCWREEQNPGK